MNRMIPAPEKLITLTTDFGTRDGYAGAMKGVIRQTAGDALIHDVTHEIPAGDIRSGAWALRTSVPFYPRGTVHVAVIDPGVGTSRAALVAAVDGQFVIGPDNGLFSWLFSEATQLRVWRLSDLSWRPSRASNTFHGRDLFAHAAALMVQEGDVAAVCAAPIDPMIAPWAVSHPYPEETVAEVVHIDHFGNVVTNLKLPQDLDVEQLVLCLPRIDLTLEGLRRTYGEVAAGTTLALVGSHEFVEVAICQGNAAQELGIRRDDRVEIRERPPR